MCAPDASRRRAIVFVGVSARLYFRLFPLFLRIVFPLFPIVLAPAAFLSPSQGLAL
jgi:hypothetical protein